MTLEINLIPPSTELLHVVVVRTLHLPLRSAQLCTCCQQAGPLWFLSC